MTTAAHPRLGHPTSTHNHALPQHLNTTVEMMSALSRSSPAKRKSSAAAEARAPTPKPSKQEGNADWPCPAKNCEGHLKLVEKRQTRGSLCTLSTATAPPVRRRALFCALLRPTLSCASSVSVLWAELHHSVSLPKTTKGTLTGTKKGGLYSISCPFFCCRLSLAFAVFSSLMCVSILLHVMWVLSGIFYILSAVCNLLCLYNKCCSTSSD